MNVEALVLDFDGVIADTEPIHFRVLRTVLAEEGYSLTAEDYTERYLGFDDAGAFRAVAGDEGRPLGEDRVTELVARKSRLMDAALAASDVLFAGAPDAIRSLSAVLPLAIASGALRGEIVAVLRPAGLLASFRAIVAAGDTTAGKPAPDPYLRAVALLGVSAGRAVAVEDSHWGLASARAAGLGTIAVTTSYPASALPLADLVVPDLASVTLERLAALPLRQG
jgi:beta-phosphoglucomutase